MAAYHVDDIWVCEGCEKEYKTKAATYRHEKDCKELQSVFRKFGLWLSRRFVKKYGFDRRKRATKVFEFLYFRYLSDIAAATVASLIVIFRVIAIYEIEGVPFSGSMEFTSEAILTISIALWILVGRIEAIREYRLKVVQEIPKLRDELGRAKPRKKK